MLELRLASLFLVAACRIEQPVATFLTKQMISSDVNDRARALQRYYVYYKHKLLRFNTFYAACLQVSLIFSRVMERDQWCKIYLTRNVPSYMGIYRVKTDRMNITGSIMLYQNGARSYIFPRIICKFQSSCFFFQNSS